MTDNLTRCQTKPCNTIIFLKGGLRTSGFGGGVGGGYGGRILTLTNRFIYKRIIATSESRFKIFVSLFQFTGRGFGGGSFYAVILVQVYKI